jgi:hypothetical protein
LGISLRYRAFFIILPYNLVILSAAKNLGSYHVSFFIILPYSLVILSAAKNLGSCHVSFFAALRMTIYDQDDRAMADLVYEHSIYEEMHRPVTTSDC